MSANALRNRKKKQKRKAKRREKQESLKSDGQKIDGLASILADKDVSKSVKDVREALAKAATARSELKKS